jgi:transposase
MLTPNVRRTWAPKGKTPHVYHWFKQDKISAIGALSVSPIYKRVQFFIRFRSRNLSSRHVIQFLTHLLKHLRGHIFLLWDGSPIHKSKVVTQFLKKHPRLRPERFPAYAPELNPVEYFWGQADAALSNGAPADLPKLSSQLHQHTRRIRSSKQLLRSCIHASGLKLFE